MWIILVSFFLPIPVNEIQILLIFLISSTAGTGGMVRLETRDLAEAHHFTRKQKVNTAEFEKLSIGYESMTTMSDIDSEVRSVTYHCFWL